MQRFILTILGLVIIAVAGLLFLEERFGIGISSILNRTSSKIEQDISKIKIESFEGYRATPITYKKGEEVSVSAVVANKGSQSATQSYSFKVYLVTGVWDTLKRDMSFVNKETNAVTDNSQEIITESDLLEMVKEKECVPVNGNCYDNINIEDNNNKFGGAQVSFDNPIYEIDFDIAIAANTSHTQVVEFNPTSCGYYMFVLGDKSYWSSGDAGDSKVGFIAVNGCNEGQIASGVSDERINNNDIVNGPRANNVEELPKAGGGLLFYVLLVTSCGLLLRKLSKT